MGLLEVGKEYSFRGKERHSMLFCLRLFLPVKTAEGEGTLLEC